MAATRTLWAGSLYGTNTANLFAELEIDGDKIEGKIRMLDPIHGLAIYSVAGTSGDIMEFTGHPIQVPEGDDQAYGEIQAKAALSKDGNLQGEWSSTIGTAGTFVLHPHGGAVTEKSESGESNPPEQLVTRNSQVGAVRLYKENIDQILQKIRTDFTRGVPIVTFVDGGNEYTKYVDQFFEQVRNSSPLKYLKIQIQEPEAHGINKIAVVELNANSANEVRVQGVRESWVRGQCDVLENVLHAAESNLVTNFKKFGLNFNQFVLLAMLVVLPDFSDWQVRAIFLAIVLFLVGAIQYAHTRFIPTTLIYVGEKPPSIWTKIIPTILSWLVAASATVIGSAAFWYLQKRYG